MDLKDLVQESVQFEQEDIEKNKTIAALAYLLFFLPLVVCPDSKFGRFHANQALVMLITSIAGSIVVTVLTFVFALVLPFLTIVTTLLSIVLSVAIFALFLYGLIFTLKGEARPLPVIGKFTILK